MPIAARRACVVLAVLLLGYAAEPLGVAAQPRAGVHIRGEAQLFGLVVLPFEDGSEPSVGFGLSLGAAWGRIPLTLGFDFMSTYGVTDRSRSFVAVGEDRLPVDTTREDGRMFFDLWLRVQPADWRVRPYIEGFVGQQFLSAEYTVGVARLPGATSFTDSRDWEMTLGYGAGLDLNLFGGTFSLALGLRRAHASDARIAQTLHTELGDARVEQTATLSATMVTLAMTAHFDFAGSRGPTP